MKNVCIILLLLQHKTLTLLIAIELFGQENFDCKNKKLRSNDEFKKLSFKAVNVSYDNCMTNEAIKEALKNENKLNALKSELEGKILGAIHDAD